jgi:hypothetical protein
MFEVLKIFEILFPENGAFASLVSGTSDIATTNEHDFAAQQVTHGGFILR